MTQTQVQAEAERAARNDNAKPSPSAAQDSTTDGMDIHTLHPLDVAVVNGGSDATTTTITTTNKDACGHRLPLHHLVHELVVGHRHMCPVCATKITHIVDAASLEAQSVVVVDENAAATPPPQQQQQIHHDKNVIVFQYGKQTYRLLCEKQQRHDTSWWQWWRSFFSITTKTASIFTVSCTAQERIICALHLHPASLKILSHSKLVYPLKAKTDNRATSHPMHDKDDGWNMSRQLVQMSTRNTTSSNVDNGKNKDQRTTTKPNKVKKTSLVVMGTRVGQELMNQQTYSHGYRWGWWVSSIWQWTLTNLQWLYRCIADRATLPPSSSSPPPTTTTENHHFHHD